MSESAAVRRDTVLVVDDTPETLGLLTDTLDQAGFTVLIATDGETALDLVGQVTPDLVLMDALMPGISGFETCKRLKRDQLLSDMPVIFMTGLSETEHVLEGLACGGVDYVTKPIVLDELLARIRVHLGNARLALETRAVLDASGRFLLATDRAGRVLWCTPKARAVRKNAQALPARRAAAARPPCRPASSSNCCACAAATPRGPRAAWWRSPGGAWSARCSARSVPTNCCSGWPSSPTPTVKSRCCKTPSA